MLFSPFTGALAATLAMGCLAAPAALAQNQVANYGFGKPGTAAYEHYSFWTNGQQRTDIHYAYGKTRQDIALRYAGGVRLGSQVGFRVRFPNGLLMSLVSSGNTLRVTTKTAPPKTFAWEYEGPVNGVGTFCSVCAEDAPAAMRLLQKYYLR